MSVMPNNTNPVVDAEQLRRDALTYLRNTVAGSPDFAHHWTVINIDATPGGLVLDLNDGTSIHLDVRREARPA